DAGACPSTPTQRAAAQISEARIGGPIVDHTEAPLHQSPHVLAKTARVRLKVVVVSQTAWNGTFGPGGGGGGRVSSGQRSGQRARGGLLVALQKQHGRGGSGKQSSPGTTTQPSMRAGHTARGGGRDGCGSGAGGGKGVLSPGQLPTVRAASVALVINA